MLIDNNYITRREELVVFGSYLYKALFDEEISKYFKDEVDETVKSSEVLRLVLEFERGALEHGPAAVFLDWRRLRKGVI